MSRKFGLSTSKNILYKYINNRLDKLDGTERVGYEVLGPILYYLTTWIHDKVQKNDIKKLYFLSRDGFLIMKAYEELYSEEQVECHYLLVSSKSVRNAFKNTNCQKKLFIKYLRQNNMHGKVAIIDIGWSGRLHKMLTSLANDFAEVCGFYFGTFKLFYKNISDGISGGYLDISRWKRAQIFMNAGFIEILFSDTQHGTTERYEQNDTEVIPVTSQANPNGNKLKKIQAGALRFLKDWNDSRYCDLSFSSAYLIKPMLQFSMNPKVEDLEDLMDEQTGSGNDYKPLVGVNMDGNGMIKKLEELRQVCWKGGFISLNFPKCIHIIYKFLNPILVYFKG